MRPVSYAQNTLRSLKERALASIEKYDVGDMIAPVVWCFETYPTLSMVMSFILVAYSIPVFVFLVFAIISVLITFTGFLVVEGAILGAGFLVLLSVLSGITVVLGSVLFGLWLVYITVAQVCELFLTNSGPQIRFSPPPPLHNHNTHIHHHIQHTEE